MQSAPMHPPTKGAANRSVELIMILDRSGSMADIVDDAIGGLNTFLDQQKQQSGKTTVSIVLFDDQFEKPYDGVDVQTIPAFDTKSYVPRGMTALLDAIGRTVSEASERINKLPDADKPGVVICVILTDGMENASKDWTKEKVLELTEKKTKDDHWDFLYLASGQDAIQTGSGIGVGFTGSLSVGAVGPAGPLGPRGLMRSQDMGASYSAVTSRVQSLRTSDNLVAAQASSDWKKDYYEEADGKVPDELQTQENDEDGD